MKRFGYAAWLLISLNGCWAENLCWGDNSPGIAPMQASMIDVARANQIIDAAITSGDRSPGQVVVAYFTPSDRAPAKDHVARIRRITEATATFYENELTRHGFADRKMSILRNQQGDVEVVDVVGSETDANYGKPDGSKIRNEVIPVLRARGIDSDRIVLLLFCNMMDYDAEKSTISHHSPYYGGGSHLSGTAWQCDSEILDPLRLRDATPIQDGEYGRITVGRHNSIFIGGVIHELGHALSLPHCRQRQDEATRGTALMGSGNRTYGEELRGEGLGTFLTQAHAMRLAAHPVFLQRVAPTIYDPPRVDWDALSIRTVTNRFIQIEGKVRSAIPIHSVIAYFDPAGGSNYDATTAVSVPTNEGQFVMRSEALSPGLAGELRLTACHVNGATTTREFRYLVDSQGQPNLASIRVDLELNDVLDQLRKGDVAKARQALNTVAKRDRSLRAIGDALLERFDSPSKALTLKPEAVPPRVRSVGLTTLIPSIAEVGWIRPTYDRVPSDEVLLCLEGDYFGRGIYAHAPAKHVYELNGKWSGLTGQCGLQSGHPGSVSFEILGDGRSLWKESGIKIGSKALFKVNVRGIKTLTLLVTDAGDGTGADWGIWVDPVLSR